MIPAVLPLLVASQLAATTPFDLPLLPRERQALISFYHQLHGEEWTDDTGWLGPPGTECQWFGVGCSCVEDPPNCTSARVVGLELAGNNLRGRLRNNVLRELPSLGLVDLSQNQLTGPLPSALWSLHALEYLYLWGNQFDGPIPSAIGRLKKLRELDLSGNELEGEIPSTLGRLRDLEILGLVSNRLRGQLPSSLSKLSRLLALVVSSNEISGQIPGWLPRLGRLRILGLGRTRITGPIPPELLLMPSLSSLDLSHMAITGTIPDAIGASQVQELWTHGTTLSGAIPRSIMSSRISHLPVQWNGLYTDDPEVDAYVGWLTEIDGWQFFQTLAPRDLRGTQEGQRSVKLTWTPVNYHPDRIDAAGGYEIHLRRGDEEYRRVRTIDGKGQSEVVLDGLDPGETYRLRLRTVTKPHRENPNTVRSAFSEEAEVSLDP